MYIHKSIYSSQSFVLSSLHCILDIVCAAMPHLAVLRFEGNHNGDAKSSSCTMHSKCSVAPDGYIVSQNLFPLPMCTILHRCRLWLLTAV